MKEIRIFFRLKGAFLFSVELMNFLNTCRKVLRFFTSAIIFEFFHLVKRYTLNFWNFFDLEKAFSVPSGIKNGLLLGFWHWDFSQKIFPLQKLFLMFRVLYNNQVTKIAQLIGRVCQARGHGFEAGVKRYIFSGKYRYLAGVLFHILTHSFFPFQNSLKKIFRTFRILHSWK